MTRIQNALICSVFTVALAASLFAGIPAAFSQIACIAGANPDACTVAAGATVPGDVDTNGNGHTISNAGTITGRILTQDDNSGVINSGSVGTSLRTFTDNSTVINSGSVGSNIQTLGANSAVTNSGSTGTFIRTTGVNSGVTNSGSVTTFIRTNGVNSGVTNTGSVSTFIRTTETDSWVINSGFIGTFLKTDNTNSWIINSGSVSSLIRTAGDNSAVINSGPVGSGAVGDGIFIEGLNPNLTLLPGSLIQGDIDLSGAGVRTLNVGKGLSIANTFVTGPDVINSNGAPFAQNGLQVAVVDPTSLAVQDELLADLTNGISSSVLNRLSNMRGGVAGVTSNPRPMYAGGSRDGEAPLESNQYWVQAFGAKRDQDGDGPAGDTDQSLYGFVSGMDALYAVDTRAGFFLGGSFGEVSAQFNSQDTEIDSFFGGFYLSTLRGRTAIDMAMTVGYSDYDRERHVANNLAPDGIETARADYDGWFVSPELTLTRPFWPMGRRIEQSVTLRYAGLFLDGFTENSTAAPLIVQDRDVHVGQARVQLAVPLTHEAKDGAMSRLMLKGGAQIRTQFGDRDISGTLLAQNITFNPGGERTATGGFVGLSAEHVTPGGLSFNATAEGLFEDNGSTQVSGKVGVKFQF